MKTLRVSLLTGASAAAITFITLTSAQTNPDKKPDQPPSDTPQQPAQAQPTQQPQQSQTSSHPAQAQPPQSSQPQQPSQPQQAPQAQPQSSAQAASPAPQPPASATAATERAGSPIHAAPRDVKQHTEQKFTGHVVRGRDGEKLGKLKEFLVDPASGDVAFGIVNSGGFVGVGDKHHIVPFKALKSARKADEFDVALNKAEWAELPAMKDEELKDSRITMSDAERRQIAQRFERAQSGEAASGSAFYTENISSHLLRSSELHGKDVHVGYREIGTIETIVIDPATGKALALFDAKKDFIGGSRGGKFLVPLDRFAFGANPHEHVTTRLARADFQAAMPGPLVASLATPQVTPAPGSPSSQAATAAETRDALATSGATQVAATGGKESAQPQAQSGAAPSQLQQPPSPAPSGATAQADNKSKSETPASSATGESREAKQEVAANTGRTAAQPSAPSASSGLREPELSPTGKTSAEQTPGGDPALVRAAQAIRSALDTDDALAHLDVHVSPEGGKLILRGTVHDEDQKKSVEQQAETAANGQKIESQLAVRNK